MTELRVDEDGTGYVVTVADEAGASEHRVTISDAHRSLMGDELPEEFLKRTFRFLLAREPKESIMASFDTSVIPRFFPEYEDEMRG